MNLDQAIGPDLEAKRRTSAELQPLNAKAFGIVMDQVAKHVSNASGVAASVNVRRLIDAPDSSFRHVVKDELDKHAKRQDNDEQSALSKLKDVADQFSGALNTLKKIAEPFEDANGVWVKAQAPVDGWASGDKPEVTGVVFQHCTNLSADTHEFVRVRQENEALKLDLADEQATSTRLRKERETTEYEHEEYCERLKEAHEQQLSELTKQLVEKQRQLDRYTDAMIVKAELDAKKTVNFDDEPPAKRVKSLGDVDTDESSKEAVVPIDTKAKLTIKEKADLKAAEAKQLADTMATVGRQEDDPESPPKVAPKAAKKKTNVKGRK